jgi:hypothetical protein
MSAQKNVLQLSVTLLLLIILVGCAPGTSNTPKAGASMSQAIVEPYLKIHAALANDSIDEVKANAGNIATAATTLGAPAMRIDTAAVQLASVADLDDARDKFGRLSEAIETYMKGLGLKAPGGVRIAYCPMALRPWLQEDGALANPYYGKSMSTCGSFR